MKIINEVISVQVDAARPDVPRIVEWRGSVFSVLRILDQWKVTTKWWTEEVSRHFLVLFTDTLVMEVYHDTRNNSWTLYRLYGA